MDLHSLELVLVHKHPRSAYIFINNSLATATFFTCSQGIIFQNGKSSSEISIGCPWDSKGSWLAFWL